MMGVGVIGGVVGTIATGGIGGLVIGGAIGGTAGYGIGKTKQNIDKDRNEKVQFEGLDKKEE